MDVKILLEGLKLRAAPIQDGQHFFAHERSFPWLSPEWQRSATSGDAQSASNSEGFARVLERGLRRHASYGLHRTNSLHASSILNLQMLYEGAYPFRAAVLLPVDRTYQDGIALPPRENHP